MLARLALIVVLGCGCGSKNGGDRGSHAELERARVCNADSDCVHLGDACDWGCAVTVNKQSAGEIEKQMRASTEPCHMDCPPVGPPVCEDHRCRSPDRKATPRCTSAEDCALSCFASINDCCGEPCGCNHPHPKAEIASFEREHAERCARVEEDCKQERCEVKSYAPGCIDGACVALPVP